MFKLSEYIQTKWYQPTFSISLIPLWPFSVLFKCLAAINKQYSIRQPIDHGLPVWVVGNISVGGTGKTPVTIALVNYCQQQNISVGIVSRGYGGTEGRDKAYLLNDTTTAAQSGDEPLLMYKRLHCPVAIGSNRNQAIAALQNAHPNVQLIISDDGLQHYAMHRDIEIAVVDGSRGLGNSKLLPAGPLREPATRLNSVDLIIHNGDMSPACQQALSGFENKLHAMQLLSSELVALAHLAKPAFAHSAKEMLKKPEPGQTIHAVAGIGHPPRFFDALRLLGFEVIEHGFPDHYQYQACDLQFGDKHAIIMTEKDAVKCTQLELQANTFYLPVNAQFSSHFYQQLESLLAGIR